MFDVAIIGAGPAGSSAAYDLAEAGLEVLVIDKNEFPRVKPCAGGVTPKAFKAFRYDITPVVKNICRQVKITRNNGSSFYISHEKPLCYMTDRSDLDFFSLKKSIEKGVCFKTINRIKSINEYDSHVEINSGYSIYRANYLIGADGANSIVRRLFLKSLPVYKCFGVEADVKVPDWHKFSMEFDFSNQLKGYYWIFPKKDSLNIGIYSPGIKINQARKRLLKYAALRTGQHHINGFRGYPIPVTGTGNKSFFCKGRVFLAGDAAGTAEPLLGEGIYFAVKSGQLAAGAILDSKYLGLPPDYIYQRSLKSLQMDLKLYAMASKCLYRFSFISLYALSIPFIYRPFANAYAKGMSLVNMASNPSFVR